MAFLIPVCCFGTKEKPHKKIFYRIASEKKLTINEGKGIDCPLCKALNKMSELSMKYEH